MIHLVPPNCELRIVSGTTELEFIPMLAEIQYAIVAVVRKCAPAWHHMRFCIQCNCQVAIIRLLAAFKFWQYR